MQTTVTLVENKFKTGLKKGAHSNFFSTCYFFLILIHKHLLLILISNFPALGPFPSTLKLLPITGTSVAMNTSKIGQFFSFLLGSKMQGLLQSSIQALEACCNHRHPGGNDHKWKLSHAVAMGLLWPMVNGQPFFTALLFPQDRAKMHFEINCN